VFLHCRISAVFLVEMTGATDQAPGMAQNNNPGVKDL
jgi:hypothetical protein